MQHLTLRMRRTAMDRRGFSATGTVVHEGLTLGVTLAAAISAWDLAVDAVASRAPVFAALVGRGVASLFGADAGGYGVALTWYAALHLTVFLAVGIVIARVLALAERHHVVLVLAVISLTIAQIALVGVTALLAEGPFGSAAWVTVPGSVVVGLAVVGLHIRRRHPHLRHALIDADDTDDWS
jgi:hypothetical protein